MATLTCWGWRRFSSEKLTILLGFLFFGGREFNAGLLLRLTKDSGRNCRRFDAQNGMIYDSNLTKIGRLLIQAPWQKLISKGDMALTIPFNMRTLKPPMWLERMQNSVDDLWLNEWIKVQTPLFGQILEWLMEIMGFMTFMEGGNDCKSCSQLGGSASPHLIWHF